ncbi:MAG: LolA-related protein [Pseudomonadota bacterium]
MMTTPPPSPRISAVLPRILVTLGVLLLPAFGHAATWDIDQLMQGLARIRTSQANFVEKKTIAMLDRPVESAGELFYRAPDHLEKRTLKPKPESMIVDGDSLIIEKGHKKYRLQLADYPELAAFIDSIRGTLAGDRKALERNYRLSLDGTAEHWILQLVPTDAKMQAVVQRIRIAGELDTVRSIEINQADGDSSKMLIEKLVTP